MGSSLQPLRQRLVIEPEQSPVRHEWSAVPQLEQLFKGLLKFSNAQRRPFGSPPVIENRRWSAVYEQQATVVCLGLLSTDATQVAAVEPVPHLGGQREGGEPAVQRVSALVRKIRLASRGPISWTQNGISMC